MARNTPAGIMGSTLPWFECDSAQVGDVEVTSVTCKRTGCGRTFYVEETPDRPTMPCPYCFKVSQFTEPEQGELF